MHKLCWLNAQISGCLANEVLPFEGGKRVLFQFLADKTGWLIAKHGVANVRNDLANLSLAKSGFGLMHKSCWLNAYLLWCFANEVLPLEGGKRVLLGSLAPNTVWLIAKNCLANFRNRVGN